MTKKEYKKLIPYVKNFDVEKYFNDFENNEENALKFLQACFAYDSPTYRKKFLSYDYEVIITSTYIYPLKTYKFLIIANISEDQKREIFSRMNNEACNYYIRYLIENNKLTNFFDSDNIFDKSLHIDTLKIAHEHNQLYDVLKRFKIIIGEESMEKSGGEVATLVDYMCKDLEATQISELIMNNDWYFDSYLIMKFFETFNLFPKVELNMNPNFYIKNTCPDFSDTAKNYISKFIFLKCIKRCTTVTDELKYEMSKKVRVENDNYLTGSYTIYLNDLHVTDDEFKMACDTTWYVSKSVADYFIMANMSKFSGYQLYLILMYAKYSGVIKEPSISIANVIKNSEILEEENNVYNLAMRRFILDKLKEIESALNNTYYDANHIEYYLKRIYDIIRITNVYDEDREIIVDSLIRISFMLDSMNYQSNSNHTFNDLKELPESYKEIVNKKRKMIYAWLFGEGNEINVLRIEKYKDGICNFIDPVLDEEEIKLLASYFMNKKDYYSIKFIDACYKNEWFNEYVYKLNNKDFIAYLILIEKKIKPNIYFKKVEDAINYLTHSSMMFYINEDEIKLVNDEVYFKDNDLLDDKKVIV